MKNLNNIIKKVLKEESERYMFFSNLEQMKRQCGLLLDLDHDLVEKILSNGHDWAQDHIAEAKNNKPNTDKNKSTFILILVFNLK